MHADEPDDLVHDLLAEALCPRPPARPRGPRRRRHRDRHGRRRHPRPSTTGTTARRQRRVRRRRRRRPRRAVGRRRGPLRASGRPGGGSRPRAPRPDARAPRRWSSTGARPSRPTWCSGSRSSAATIRTATPPRPLVHDPRAAARRAGCSRRSGSVAGLAYSVYAYRSGFEDAGVLAIYAGTLARHGPQETLKVITGELERLADGVTEHELAVATGGIVGSMALSLEDSGARMQPDRPQPARPRRDLDRRRGRGHLPPAHDPTTCSASADPPAGPAPGAGRRRSVPRGTGGQLDVIPLRPVATPAGRRPGSSAGDGPPRRRRHYRRRLCESACSERRGGWAERCAGRWPPTPTWSWWRPSTWSRRTWPASGAGVDAPSGVRTGTDAGVMAGVDVAVDFTVAESARANARWCAAHGVHAVIGTSGLTDADAERAARAVHRASNCLIAPNFAIGAVLMIRLAELAAPFFDTAEIIELHHDGKADAPSGTAMHTAEKLAAASGDLGPRPDAGSRTCPAPGVPPAREASTSTRCGCGGWWPIRRSCSAPPARRSPSGTTPTTARRSCPACSWP